MQLHWKPVGHAEAALQLSSGGDPCGGESVPQRGER